MRSLFIFDPLDMNSKNIGGVQLCSQEFLKIIQSVSDSVDYCEVNICRKLSWRLRRKLHLGSYLFYHPEEAKHKLTSKIQQSSPTHIFINKSELLRLTPLLRELLPDSQIIVMSHGNQSGDDLYELTGEGGARNKSISKLLATWQIGQDLVTESWFRHRYIDLVCVMSEEEQVIERWLGAKNTIVLPRTVNIDTLHWKPKIGRFGFVGTLSHTPNKVALEQICLAISKNPDIISENIEFRLVGSPESEGLNLASQYKFVTYLGALDEDSLRSEVSSWSLFLNPIFWLSRGGSMKLRQAISWGIPFLTTQSGRRGYRFSDNKFLTTSDNTNEFVSKLMDLVSNKQNISLAKQIVNKIQADSPKIIDLKIELTNALKNIL